MPATLLRIGDHGFDGSDLVLVDGRSHLRRRIEAVPELERACLPGKAGDERAMARFVDVEAIRCNADLADVGY